MTFKRHKDEAPRFNPYESGLRVYGRKDVEDIPPDEAAEKTLQPALDINTFNTRKREIFNAHPDNTLPQKPNLDLVLPEGVDPQGPVLQLASAGIRGYGFVSVFSVDSSKATRSWRETDNMTQWLEGVAVKHAPDTGVMLLFVERSEDLSDESLGPRLSNLHGALSKLTVPRLTIVTTAAPHGAEPLQDTPKIEPSMLQPQDHDVGPGMDML